MGYSMRLVAPWISIIGFEIAMMWLCWRIILCMWRDFCAQLSKAWRDLQ
jgi:hypothetical protein